MKIRRGVRRAVALGAVATVLAGCATAPPVATVGNDIQVTASVAAGGQIVDATVKVDDTILNRDIVPSTGYKYTIKKWSGKLVEFTATATNGAIKCTLVPVGHKAIEETGAIERSGDAKCKVTIEPIEPKPTAS